MTAAAGAYVQYPAEDLLRLLALESTRAKTLVIGEDLGTVPDYVRKRLDQYKILSYRVFYFERDWNEGSFNPPSAYPEQSLAVVTTHDLPTLAGYWSGEDIRLRASLDMYQSEEAHQQACDERMRDKQHMLAALQRAGLLEGLSDHVEQQSVMTPELCRAIHAYLASSRAWIVMANLDDMIGEVTQMNLPGTLDAYPNWSRKLSLSLEELQRDERLQLLAAAVRSLRSPAAAS